MVRQFCDLGDHVTFLYRSDEASAQCVSAETGAHGLRCDVADEGDVINTFSHLPEPDILINNAGVAWYGLLQDMSLTDFQYLMNVNLTGTFLCTRAVIPAMVRRHGGVILNISSMWGQEGASCEAAYSASKAAVIGLTKSLARELGPSGIRVNAIAPGVIQTEMLRHLNQAELEDLRQETPLGQLGSPQDVASAAAYLCSPAAAFITGEILNISGGFVMF